VKRVRRHHRLDKGMRGWIVNHAKRNYWRVASWYDIEDLIQDGFVCYCKCLERYGHLLEQRHFMALVKITFINHIHDLSSQSSKNPSVHTAPISDVMRADCENVNEALDELAAPVPEEATFRVLLGQLPRELKELVNTLLNDVQLPEFERLPRETTNEWLCRLAGLPSKRVDVETELKRHFGLLESSPIAKGQGEMLYVDGELKMKNVIQTT